MTAEEKLKEIKEVLSEKNGVSDNQEFGLSWGQLIDYLERIEEIVNK